MSQSLVSVIVPVKNRSDELKRALESVIGQTYKIFEVLVVDDKSVEDIKKIVSDFNDSRILYFLNDHQLSNANVCRNIGLKHAKGEYIAMLDSDDEWLSIHLESKIQYIERYNCDGVFGSAHVDNGVERRLRLSRPRSKGESMLDYLLTTGKAPTPTHVCKTLPAKQIGWDETLIRHQDFDFSARFSEKYTFLACEEPTVIIHWGADEKRSIDLVSQELFIRKHYSRISPHVLVKYLTQSISNWMNDSDQEKIRVREFFKKTALSHIRFMSYADYQLLVPNKTLISRVSSRLKFAMRVVFDF